MAEPVFFRVNPQKTVEALAYLGAKKPGLDVFHVCKIIFYADLTHFQKFGRPILGDMYCAMDDGPVPSLVYDIMKMNPRRDKEIIEYAIARLKIGKSPKGYAILEGALQDYEADLFSKTDIQCLDESIQTYGEMPFLKLWALVHEEPAYKAKYAGKQTSTVIPYELFIPASTKDRDKVIEQIRETARVTAL